MLTSSKEVKASKKLRIEEIRSTSNNKVTFYVFIIVTMPTFKLAPLIIG